MHNALTKYNFEILIWILIIIFLLTLSNPNYYFLHYWLISWNNSFINYFSHSFLHWDIYHILFNTIALYSIKDLFKKEFILIFFLKIFFLSFLTAIIFIQLSNIFWDWNFLLIWFSWVIFWLLTMQLLEIFFNKKWFKLNLKFIWIIFLLNIIILPYLFPNISWLWHFAGVLAGWGLYVFEKIVSVIFKR